MEIYKTLTSFSLINPQKLFEKDFSSGFIAKYDNMKRIS
jgi:hypothetical protein